MALELDSHGSLVRQRLRAAVLPLPVRLVMLRGSESLEIGQVMSEVSANAILELDGAGSATFSARGYELTTRRMAYYSIPIGYQAYVLVPPGPSLPTSPGILVDETVEDPRPALKHHMIGTLLALMEVAGLPTSFDPNQTLDDALATFGDAPSWAVQTLLGSLVADPPLAELLSAARSITRHSFDLDGRRIQRRNPQ